MKVIVFLVLGIFGLGASECSNPKVRSDSGAVYAIDANDPTVVIQGGGGCITDPKVGYTYCRKREGTTTNDGLTFYAPPVDCGAEQCAIDVEVLFPDNTPSIVFQIPKGQTRRSVSWKELTHSDTYQRDFSGFWIVLMTWNWVGEDEHSHPTTVEGEIRLRVLRSNYTPLQNAKEDANFVWKTSEGGNQFRWTTHGRAAVWKE